MGKKDKKKNKHNHSSLADHKQEKKQLIPPFLQIPRMMHVSWIDDRLPEMLWAILIIGNMEREKALGVFRVVGKFSEENSECWDVTMSGISKWEDDKRKNFIELLSSYSEEVGKILKPLIFFKDLPSFDDWKEKISEPDAESDWTILFNGVGKTLWHQSQEATDCRWVKVLCLLTSGKLKMVDAESIKEVLYYPNYGDMRGVRPIIRATEITPAMQMEKNTWPEIFWATCFNNTYCMPEETYNEKALPKKQSFVDEVEEIRPFYFEDAKKIRNELVEHYLSIPDNSTIDSRYESAFGLAFYGLSIFVEIIFYRNPLSITGRLALRSLVETYITFEYLLQKEKVEPKIWDDYRSYGSGQSKLVYSKLEEMGCNPKSINLEEIESMANEDRWVEFVPINLGHWDSADLRKMSMETGLKDLYDQFYSYTSGFIHGNWGAVRESMYQKCVNPLHRFHRLPVYEMPLMPSVTEDCRDIANKMLSCLNRAYPGFNSQIAQYVKPEKPVEENPKA